MSIYMSTFSLALLLLSWFPSIPGNYVVRKCLLYFFIAMGRAAGQGASTIKWVVNAEV